MVLALCFNNKQLTFHMFIFIYSLYGSEAAFISISLLFKWLMLSQNWRWGPLRVARVDVGRVVQYSCSVGTHKATSPNKNGWLFCTLLTAVREGPGNRNWNIPLFRANNSTLSKDNNTSINHLIDFYASCGGTSKKKQPVNSKRPLSWLPFPTTLETFSWNGWFFVLHRFHPLQFCWFVVRQSLFFQFPWLDSGTQLVEFNAVSCWLIWTILCK